MGIKSIFSLFILALVPIVIGAQSTEKLPTLVEHTIAHKVAKVNIREAIKETKIYDDKKLKASIAQSKKPKNFPGRFPRQIIRSELEHLGADKLRQNEVSASRKPPIKFIVNRDGLDTNSSPGDPSGDVGLDHYMQAVNATQIGVFTKEGDLVQEYRSSALWSAIGIPPGGDPIIVYDQEYDKWIITEFPSPFFSDANQLLVAVSETSDPLGEYSLYNFQTPSFPDYPKYSLWSETIIVTTNEQGPGRLYAYMINRADLITAQDEVRIQRHSVGGAPGAEQGFIVAMPVNWLGKTAPSDERPMIVSLSDASWSNSQSQDEINIYSFDVNWNNPDSTESEKRRIPVSNYDSHPCSESGFLFQCIPQRGGDGLDGLPEIINFQPNYRNFGSYEAMVFSFITDVTDGDDLAGIRWMELRRTANTEWELYQEGTYAPDDGLNRFMCNVALDGDGNIALAYSTSSDSTYADLRVTGRHNSDELGLMTFPETRIIEGNNPINSGSRFGDYSHLTVDPVDDLTFWFTSEYANAGTRSTSRIASFQLAKRDYDLAVRQLITPTDSPTLTTDEIIEFTIKNVGALHISNFDVGYTLDNGIKIIENVAITLESDSTYSHAFQQPGDFSTVGDHILTLFATATQDESPGNDTLRATVVNLPTHDLIATRIVGLENTICGNEADIEIEFTNAGQEELTSAMITVFLNGVTIGTFEYMGSVPFDSEGYYPMTLTNLQEGTNEITFEIIEPNGQPDQFPGNNLFTQSFDVETNTDFIILEILTDDYPEENTWEIADENGNILFQGDLEDVGEQSVFTQQFCVDPDLCYVFTIYDQFGDGMATVGEPEGTYLITNEDGQPLAGIINAAFGSEESNSFCPEFECNLEIAVSIDEENGSILVEVINGIGPDFLYSIDGGNELTDNPVFLDLDAGSYELVVQDNYGCVITQPIVLLPSSATESGQDLLSVMLSPNPTTDNFMLEVTGLDGGSSLPITAFSLDGQVVSRTVIPKYSGIYKGMISLIPFPAGTYLIKLESKSPQLLRVIKE